MGERYLGEHRAKDGGSFAAATAGGLVLRFDGAGQLVPAGATDADSIGFSDGESNGLGDGNFILRNTAGLVSLTAAGDRFIVLPG